MKRVEKVLEKVYSKFGSKDGYWLSKICQENGSPWSQFYNWLLTEQFIPNRSIKEYFKVVEFDHFK